MNDTKKNKDQNNVMVEKKTTDESARGLLPSDDWEHWFDDMLSRRWPSPFDLKFPRFPHLHFADTEMPKVDIIEKDDLVEVHAALPGVKKEDLDVSLGRQTITLKASTREEKKKEEGEYFRREIRRGSFQRTLPLPAAVDADKAKATFKDGLLEILLPKIEKSRRKSIEIK